MNFAERKKKQKIDFKKYKYFRNFHEELHVYDKGYTNDVTLKFLCKNIVLFQRAYMTDLIKWKKNDKRVPTGIIESNSEKIFSIYKNNKKKLEIQVNKFIKELQSIGCENPLIVCMGAKTYMLINQFINNILDELGDKTKIIRITHYSRQRGREKEYIKKVKEELKQQKVKI
ncbi:MAG: hypothetical protein J6O41_06885 [Clostridia bacterium]|nr:hypothetical protein [Clostridia bacterium]